jgi:predicted CXXCH cytochrome family protein
VRRLALLFAGGAVWLFLAAIPVLADGGPHVAAINSGSAGITADSCAGCHRAHTAQGYYLLNGAGGPAACLVCHGASGNGATTDVATGIQYTPSGAAGTDRGAALGALRSGGFVQARIGSGATARLAYLSGTSVRQLMKVPVSATPQNVTSAHLPNVAGVVEDSAGSAWGNGPDSMVVNPGPAVAITCTTCHNPHGNGNYRILNPVPQPEAIAGGGTFIPVASPGVVVTDAALPVAPDTRNYTVIQTAGGTGTLLATQVTALGLPSTAGDYFRRKVPWNGTSGTSNDAPNGLSTNFTTQLSAWCLTCHTRYISDSWETEHPDAIFKYRHTSTNVSRNCATCHVAHGSNAQMTGTYSATMTYPGGLAAPVGDSRLLKIDNRGTCQACHDPTGTITAGTFVGPTPVPLVP